MYAFDPIQNAILLIGGDKTGNNRWYEIYIPVAERLFEAHIQALIQENLIQLAQQKKE